jgi:crossover junction endodeoxyribonuclease RuvC
VVGVLALGIDPGYAHLGIGLVELLPTRTRCVHHETFITKTRDEVDDRLDAIAEHLFQVIEHYNPAAIGFEDQAGVEVAASRRAKDEDEGVWSNVNSRRVHEVVGIIRAAARFYDLARYRLAVSSVKCAVLGKGGSRAKKDAVKERVRAIFGIPSLSEHAADALAVAIGTGVRHRRHVATLAAHTSLIH